MATRVKTKIKTKSRCPFCTGKGDKINYSSPMFANGSPCHRGPYLWERNENVCPYCFGGGHKTDGTICECQQ